MFINEIAANLLKRYQIHQSTERLFIVGIDGLGGSGKTTLAKTLYDHLNMQNYEVSLIHLDDYIVARDRRYRTGEPDWYEYYYLQWDIEVLKEDLFFKLYRNDSKLSLPYYDKENDIITAQKMTINPKSIIFIEGVFLQRTEWRKYFDYVIYIDCPDELRKERVLNRDVYIGSYKARLKKYKIRYWLGEEHYLKILDPKKYADEIVDVIR